MNASTPVKHKTPNYKQVGYVQKHTGVFGQPRTRTVWLWEAQPLRQTRKDLHTT